VREKVNVLSTDHGKTLIADIGKVYSAVRAGLKNLRFCLSSSSDEIGALYP
jgi:hypothetical protein